LVLQTQANKFATRFHEEKKKKLNSLLDIEQWKSLNAIPGDFQDVMNQVTEGVRFSELKRGRVTEENGASYVLIHGEKYVLVSSVITLVNSVIDYCQCSHEIQALSPDLLTRLLDLLKQFNSRSSRLVLGGGAVQLAGLRTITARNLVNSGRGLQVILAVLPYVKRHFEEVLPSKQRSMAKHFEDITHVYLEHVERIPNKLVHIIRESMLVDLAKWEARPPVPSPQFQAVSQHLNLLHNNVQEALPVKELVDLFSQIHETFKDVLRLQLVRLKIANDGGPQHGLVTQELTFYLQNLSKHEVAKHIKFSNDDLWTR
jgi:vacuolar protein sorting-associated protein 54